MSKSLCIFLALAIAGAAANSWNYPRTWIKTGECLDSNVGPLVLGTTPPVNPNVVETVENANNLNHCADMCQNNTACNYFTYYRDQISIAKRAEYNCTLVGYNLRHACFHLERACVLLKNCEVFNPECQSCRTGGRALYKSSALPRTLILNGVVDDREYKENDVPQYSEEAANFAELIVNSSYTCLISTQLKDTVTGVAPNLVTETQIKPRFGSSAAFVHDKIFNCGGYSLKEEKYLADCQVFTNGSMPPWEYGDPIEVSNGRAFGAMVATASNVAYYLGGYNMVDGFLNSVGLLAAAGTWSGQPAMNMPEKKSHFCAVYDNIADIRGEKWLYTIGGWNINYLSSIHRINIGDTDGLATGSWEQYSTDLTEARSDHACAMAQHGWKRGILVAGGYRTDGAWMTKVEFLDIERGVFLSPDLFPRLNEGRHYNGLANIDFLPFVFGGWNNGSMNSLEYLDEKIPEPTWKKEKNLHLVVAREKFAYVELPYEFMPDCPL